MASLVTTTVTGTLTTTDTLTVGPSNNSKIYMGGNDYIAFTDAVGDGFKFVYDNSEKVRITNVGNVGINITNPSYKLHVSATSTNLARFDGGSANNWISVTSADTYSAGIVYENAGTGKWYVGHYNGAPLGFSFYDASTSSVKLFIKEGGNVGIGTTNPAGDLEVSTASGGELVVDNNGASGVLLQQRNGGATNSGSFKLSGGTLISFFTNDAERVRIISDGNVGIGTDAPNARLEVQGVNRSTAFSASNGATWHDTIIANPNSTAGSAVGIFLQTSGYHSNGGTGIAAIDAGGDYSAHLVFITRPNAAVAEERMRITDTGSVGIGTNAPGSKLDVVGTTTVRYAAGDFSTKRLDIQAANTSNLIQSVTNPLHIYDNSAIRICMLQGGNVGIGTDAPGSKLQVTGDISFGTRLDSATRYIGKGNSAGGGFGGNSNWIAFASDAADDWITFGVHESGVGGGEAMRVNYNKRVGIGTTAPSKLLDVNGTAYLRDDVFYGNTVLNIASGYNNQTGMGWDKSAGQLQIAGNQCAALELGRHSSAGTILSLRYESTQVATIESSGQIRSVSGAVTAPSFSFTNDPNTGMSRPTTDTLNFVTNGTERARIDSAGVTTLTTAGNTQVNNYYASLIINNTGTSTWSRLRFDRSGVEKWGIGLGTDDKLRISNLFTGGSAASPNDSCFVIDNNGQIGINVDPDGGLKIKSRADGENVLNMVDSAGDAMFNIRQSGNDCLIRAYKDGGSQKVQIHTDGDSYFTGGEVGIGTTNPSQLLHVEKASGTTTVLTQVAANSVVGFEIKKTGSTTQHWKIVDGQTANGYLEIYDATDSATRMAFNTSGNVGIGTVDAPHLLSIKGDSKYFAAYASDGSMAVQLGADSSGDGNFMLFDHSGGTKVKLYGESGGANYINNGGNLGIGTNSPGSELDIERSHAGTNTGAPYGTGSTHINVKNTSDTDGNLAGILFEGAVSSAYMGGVFMEMENHSSYYSKLHFATRNASSFGSKMVLAKDGNVGIGVTSPGYKLDVLGDASIGSAATKLRTYSDSTYSGIFNGSSLQSDEAIYFGAGATYFYNDGSNSLTIGSNLRVELKATDYQLQYLSGVHIWYTRLTSAGTFAIHKNGVGDYLSIASGGAITFNGEFTFPTSDGSANQVLKTNGSGTLSWTDQSGGGGSGTVTSVATSTGLTGGTITTTGTLSVTTAVCMSINAPSGSAAPSSRAFTFAQSGGMTISASGSTVTFSSSSASDYRLKKNVTDFNSESWTKVKSVSCRKFDFDAEKFAQAMEDDYTIPRPASYGGRIGFIAHELQALGIDGAVEGEKDGVDENGVPIYQKVSYTTLVPVLWGALNEAIRKIEILESKVQALEDSS